ncbi:MAG TPA: STAS-like domain-containing protein [Bacteroidales bacterium]|nr:STAS-like domain-containing protein [Bacteroidales bacterium]
MNVDKYIISIYNEVNGDSAISVDDGEKVFKKIDQALSNNLKVELDFQNINLIITAFLNAAIGQLYSKYSSEELNNNLKLLNIKQEDIPLFQLVIERAKKYFENPQGFEDDVNN